MRIIVTGGNSGIGKATAAALAAAGHSVLIACRDIPKAELAAAEMAGDVDVAHLDLADLASVRRFAGSVETVDVLVNNADVFGLPLTRTVDGFEAHMGTNYLGHFALTCLLGDKIADRVASVVSAMYGPSHIHLDDLNWHTRTYSKWTAYGESKLAIMLFTHELTRRGMRAYATDPGVDGHGHHQERQPCDAMAGRAQVSAVLRAQPGAGSASHHSGGDGGPAQRHLSCAAVQPTGQAEGDSDERQGA